MSRYRLAATIGAATMALSAGAVTGSTASPGRTSSTRTPTVSCDKIILRLASGRAGGYRLVLGVVSAPRAYIPQVVAAGERPWKYWSKAGLVIRAGSRPVTVRVAEAWRSRAAITWGNSGIVHSLRIASCPAWSARRWNAYSGGFYLRARSACVPLVFRVGRRATTLRFGVGRRCAAG